MDRTTPNPPSGLMASFPGQKSTGPALPNPVLGLTATAVNAGQVNLAWTTVSGATGYNVFRGGVLISFQPGTSLADTTVVPATSYSYAVQAVNAVGTGLTATATVATPPAQVTGLTATALSTSSIRTNWTATTGATSYTVKQGGTTVGTPSSNTFTDTGLAASTLYTYTVAANGTGGQGAFSSPASATTQATSGGSIVWKPGIRLRIGGYGSLESLATYTAALDVIIPQDVNRQILGLVISPTWSQLEGPTLGDYSAGTTTIQSFITMLKTRYNTATYGFRILDLSIFLNCFGNGYSPITNPAFLPSFCPAYMNSGTKGSPTNGYGGGEVHTQSDGTTPLDRPYMVMWNVNVQGRMAPLMSHYYNTFGPDTSIGGIYRWDPLQEISISQFAPGFTNALIRDAVANLAPQWRAACPKTLITIKPTYMGPNNGSAYPPIITACLANNISWGTEDTANNRISWGEMAFLGMWPGFATTNYATSGPGGGTAWDYHCNVDGAETSYRGTQNKNPNGSYATYGSGYLYDKSASGFPGIYTAVNRCNGSHSDWYVGKQGDHTGGPQVNRRDVPPASPLANPTPGPAAGSIATRPNIIDVFTGNTSYTGVEANTGKGQGCSMASIGYPPGYPT